jgi:hypothetical protein
MEEQSHQQVAELVIDKNSGRSIGGSSLLFSISAIIAVLFCLFLFLYNFSLTRSTKGIEAQKASVMSEIQTPENQKLEETVSSTVAAIGSLKSLYNPDSYKASDFMMNFPKIVPKNTMITNLALDENDNLRIDGQTTGLSELAAFIQSMQDSNYLEGISLAGASTESVNGQAVTKFSISCRLNRDKAQAELKKAAEAAKSNVTSVPATSSTDTTSDSIPSSTTSPTTVPTP